MFLFSCERTRDSNMLNRNSVRIQPNKFPPRNYFVGPDGLRPFLFDIVSEDGPVPVMASVYGFFGGDPDAEDQRLTDATANEAPEEHLPMEYSRHLLEFEQSVAGQEGIRGTSKCTNMCWIVFPPLFTTLDYLVALQAARDEIRLRAECGADFQVKQGPSGKPATVHLSGGVFRSHGDRSDPVVGYAMFIGEP